MNLTYLLDNQRRLQVELNYCMGENEEAIKNNVLALIVEATEILNEVNWKQWSKEKKVIDEGALLFEIVDVLALLGNIINEAGFTAPQVEEAYRSKLEIYYAKARRDGHPTNVKRSGCSCLTKSEGL